MTLDPKLWEGHTRGPWLAIEGPVFDCGVYIPRDDGSYIRIAYVDHAFENREGPNPDYLRTRSANAQLIAHAPEIEAERVRLLARVAELEGALKPFADAANVRLCGEFSDKERFGQTDITFHLTFGDLRRARAALGPTP